MVGLVHTLYFYTKLLDFIIACTVMCLSIGTPKIINFPFGTNGKLMVFRCPKIWAHYSLIIMSLNIGTPENHHFPFGTNRKVLFSGIRCPNT